MELEVWKPIPGFDGYEISNYGNVRSYFTKNGDDATRSCKGSTWHLANKPQRVLKPGLSQGYKFVTLLKRGDRFVYRVHVLVALVFLGDRPVGMNVCHNDDDKLNNYLGNLRYDYQKNNVADALRNGKINRQRRIRPIPAPTKTRPSKDQAREIRELAFNKISLTEIGRMFKITKSGISRIVNGLHHKSSGGPIKGIDY